MNKIKTIVAPCMRSQARVSISVAELSALLRAEMERDILEELLSGNHHIYADDVMKALRKSRKKYLNLMCPMTIEIDFDGNEHEKECSSAESVANDSDSAGSPDTPTVVE